MRKYIFIITALIPALVFGQQFPFMEAYNINPFSLSPSYAGIHNSKTLFMDYRSDWSGIEGGPTTYQLSYSDKIRDRIGLGGKFIYDKTDIFKQTLIIGTYTYEIKLKEKHFINLGLSAGLYRNSIDLSKYYNDPTYVQDMALLYGLQQSKIKFATDISALYRYEQAEAGILFSNVMFGTVRYSNVDMTYKPLKNYLLHASYSFRLDGKWSLKPTAIFRGGQDVPVQFEISPTAYWNDRYWATITYRTHGILGFGLGGEICRGVLLNYTYNLNSSIKEYSPVTAFGSHQLTLGLNFRNLFKDKKETGLTK
jgi:type IX secretion system PorP/SprF family membrane protein